MSEGATTSPGIFGNALQRIERFLFDSPTWAYLLILHLLMWVKTGLWGIPNLMLTRQIALDPFVNPFVDPFAHYLFWSWLAPWLAWLVGATGETSFFLFNLGWLVIFNVGVVWYLLRELPPRSARIALLMFASLPISTTVWYWLCTDSLTLVLLLAAIALRRKAWVLALIGLALGMQHFEHAFLVAGLLIGFGVLRRWMPQRLPGDDAQPAEGFAILPSILLMVGIIAGKFLLIALFKHFDIVINSGRTYWLVEHWQLLMREFVNTMAYSVWSIFGVGWLLVARYLARDRGAAAFAILMLGLLLIFGMVGDKTRVLAIITFPLVMTQLLLNRPLLAGISSAETSRYFVLWLAVPWIWVALGAPQMSAFPNDLVWLWSALGGS
ncbi:MAG: hypothetical protein ABIR16_08230 [Dokdonella sp.]